MKGSDIKIARMFEHSAIYVENREAWKNQPQEILT
jgi:hypothetical protein